MAAASPTPADFASKLRDSGAGACSSRLNGLAAGTNGGVSQSDAVSTWAKTDSDKRLVGVVIGQRYPDAAAVPFAVTSVVASPDAQGECDAIALQVVPSPLSCAKVRENLAAHSTMMGDLVGIAVVSDSGGQTMLVPTASNTCVLVGVKTDYGK